MFKINVACILKRHLTNTQKSLKVLTNTALKANSFISLSSLSLNPFKCQIFNNINLYCKNFQQDSSSNTKYRKILSPIQLPNFKFSIHLSCKNLKIIYSSLDTKRNRHSHTKKKNIALYSPKKNQTLTSKSYNHKKVHNSDVQHSVNIQPGFA